MNDQPVADVRLQHFLDEEFASTEVRTVLDAGCGYSLPVRLPRDVRIVGLDSSAEALSKNEHIDEAIVGDVETYPLAGDGFDVVVCWTVLEHLANPRAALSNFAFALRPGGLLIVGIPNLWSLKGLVTKLTPHSFHVWVYRRIWGVKEAGQPGVAPFPTYLRRDIAPGRLAQSARRLGLERIYAANYRNAYPLPRVLAILWSAAEALGRIASLGSWDPGASEHVAVFRKLPRPA
jgi:SAM-dependent methyltransferase